MIGTLNEKSTHAILKKHLCSDESKHEIGVNGYIADILDSETNTITEIQTQDFSKLRGKIGSYTPEYKLNIVYPVNSIKYINWVDPDSGEVVERRKSPSRDNKYKIFKELYKIRQHLTNKQISFSIILLETEEYKYLDGYGRNNKNKATKIDKVPIKILETITFSINSGYDDFIPDALLNKSFTSKDFSKEGKCSIEIAQTTLLILTDLGIVNRIGKSGRSILYSYTN